MFLYWDRCMVIIKVYCFAGQNVHGADVGSGCAKSCDWRILSALGGDQYSSENVSLIIYGQVL